MKKRVLALLLALALSGAALPLAAAAPETGTLEAGALETEARLPVRLQDAPAREAPALVPEGTEEDAPARVLAEPDYAGAIETLRQGMVEQKEAINISAFGIPTEDISTLVNRLRYRYGELFAFTGGCGYTTTSDKKYLVRIFPKYSADLDYAQAKAFYDDTLDAIVAQVPEQASDVEKVLFVHDYLAAWGEYDYTYTYYDAYSFFRYGTGVCQAYTLAFSALMDRLGVPVTYVECEALNHIWNAVELEGKWYHVDVTWDDPTVKCPAVGTDADMLGGTWHSYFLLSDGTNRTAREDMLPEGTAYDQTCGQEVAFGDGRYETGVYAGADSPVVYVPGSGAWYYLSTDAADGGLYCLDSVAGGTRRLADYSPLGYSGGPAALTEYQGSLFYADPERIYRYELATGTLETLFQAEDGTGLSGLTVRDGTLTFRRLGRDAEQNALEELVDYTDELMPYHEAMGGAFSYYYNFGSVGLKRPADSGGQLLLAWYDPATGKLERLAAAKGDGVYGQAVTDGDLALTAFLLAEDGSLAPVQPKLPISQGTK